MPIDPVTGAAVITAAAQGANMFFQGNQNKKNRKFAEKQQQKQYEQSVELWRMNNSYNHPTEQQKRLREAGLNPHLVYGNGAVANSSGAPSTPSQARWEGKALQINPEFAQTALQNIHTLKSTQLQNDNTRKQNDLLDKQGQLLDTENLQNILNLEISTEAKQALIDKHFIQNELNKTNIAGTRNTIKTQDATIRQNDMRIALDNLRTRNTILDSRVSRRLKEAGITETQVRTHGQKYINEVNKAKAQLYRDGFTESDPLWARQLKRIADKVFGTTGPKPRRDPGLDNLPKNYYKQ